MYLLDITVSNDTLESGLVSLMAHVRPQWPADDITHKAFKGGQVNGVFGVFRKSQESNDDKEVIIVRVFGLKLAARNDGISKEQMKKFFDRTFEVTALKAASDAGLIEPLYAHFNNGVVYGFAEGDTLNEKTVFDEKVWPRIAEVVAKFHCLQVDCFKGESKEPNFPLESIRGIIGQLKSQFEKKAETDTRFKEWLALVGDFNEHYDFVKTVVPKPEDKVVFTHGDLNRFNIIYNSKKDAIKLIDFDLTNHGYQGYDIAYHFVMACGHLTTYDPTIYPNGELRLRWIRHYLKVFNEMKGIQTDDFEDDVMRLEKRVKAWTVYHHLMFGTMLPRIALNESNSTADLNPMAVGLAHFNEYLKKKETFL